MRRSVALAVNARVFYGWVMVLIAALAIFASGPGQSHTFSVFVGPIGDSLGLSNAAIASAYAFATLIAAFGLPHMGRLIDRRGPRWTMLIVAVLLGLASFVFGAAGGIVQLAIGFAALRFLGQGSLLLTSSNLVSHWFHTRRGLALSLMVLGFAASMAVHPPLGQWLIATFGWRQAWFILGAMTWVLLLPLVLFLVHNRPEDLGLRPDGAFAPERGRTAPEITGLTPHQAFRTSTFYLIAVGLFTLSMMVTALHFFQVPIFRAQGLDAGLAARVFPISAVTMVAAMPMFGRLLDRYRTEIMFSAALLITAAALAAAALVQDMASAAVYGVIFGLANACTMTLFAFIWPRYFGRLHLGSIQGAGQMVSVFGASLGPLPLGIAFDRFGSYADTLLLIAIWPALCAALVLLIRDPKVPPAP